MEKLAIKYWNYLTKGSWYGKAFKIKWLLITPLLYLLNSFIYMDWFYFINFYKSIVNDFDYRCSFTFIYLIINFFYYGVNIAIHDVNKM